MWIVLTGRPASGKTTIAAALVERRGLRVVNVGDVLSARLPDGVARHRVGPEYVSAYGIDAIADAVLEDADGSVDVVVDGVRLLQTWLGLRRVRSDASLWNVDVPPAVARTRLTERLRRAGLTDEVLGDAVRDYDLYSHDNRWLAANAHVTIDGSRPDEAVAHALAHADRLRGLRLERT